MMHSVLLRLVALKTTNLIGGNTYFNSKSDASIQVIIELPFVSQSKKDCIIVKEHEKQWLLTKQVLKLWLHFVEAKCINVC